MRVRSVTLLVLYYRNFVVNAGCALIPRKRLRNVSGGSQRIIHNFCKPTVHSLNDVGVGVEGNGNAGVAQKLLHVLGMLARVDPTRWDDERGAGGRQMIGREKQ